MISETLGWIGNVLFILGSITLAKRKPIPSLIFNLIANGFYVAMAVMLQTFALLALSITLIGLNIWGIISWRKVNKAGNGLVTRRVS